jgi:two-component system, OmpR family, response regulator
MGGGEIADSNQGFSLMAASQWERWTALRILIVDDQPRLVAPIRRALEKQGYTVDLVETGGAGIARAIEQDYDVIILDFVMPGLNGLDVIRRLRQQEQWTPILVLTGLANDVETRVLSLDGGADDFMGKPFELSELLARVRALARRKMEERPTTIEVDDLALDPATWDVSRGDTSIDLSPREFALLEYLMRHAGEVLPRRKILSSVWGFDYNGSSNVVDVYIRYLRNKIDDPFGYDSIEAIRSVGYRLRTRHRSGKATSKTA